MDFMKKDDRDEKEGNLESSFLGGSDGFDDAQGEASFESWEKSELKKKVKNLTAMLFVLGGLFVGSLYVDISQLVTKSGFSSRVLGTTDVITAAGKTWVAYDQPIVRVTAITDETCKSCQTDEALVWLRRIAPTVSVEKLDATKDARAKDVITSAGITSIPAFVFSKEVANLPIYSQAQQLFKELDKDKNKNGGFLLDTAQVGIPVGKYLELPQVGDDDIQVGPKDAPVRVVEFTDFQCPYCKAFHETLQNTLKDYGDKVLYVYKNYPLPIHAQAQGAALAGMCANEQGKFAEYADNLFSKQDEWGKTTGTQKFKDYARTLKFDVAKFNSCLDEKKYQDQVTASLDEGKKFGISGTPGTFVNGNFLNGAVPKEDLKTAIDAELALVSDSK